MCMYVYPGTIGGNEIKFISLLALLAGFPGLHYSRWGNSYMGFSISPMYICRERLHPKNGVDGEYSFTLHTFTTLQRCDKCNLTLKGLYSQGYFCPSKFVLLTLAFRCKIYRLFLRVHVSHNAWLRSSMCYWEIQLSITLRECSKYADAVEGGNSSLSWSGSCVETVWQYFTIQLASIFARKSFKWCCLAYSEEMN